MSNVKNAFSLLKKSNQAYDSRYNFPDIIIKVSTQTGYAEFLAFAEYGVFVESVEFWEIEEIGESLEFGIHVAH
jgi:hypothetical protein